MTVSRLDHVYRSILMTRFFTKGWGKPENLKRLFEFRKIVSNRQLCYQLVPDNYEIRITKEVAHSDYLILNGEFQSPLVQYLPGLVPKESETAYFQMLVPKQWKEEIFRPVCLHLAGTGDHGFWRRKQFMARPLLREGGIASILLENPFYGLRKPKEQVRSCLQNVSDIFVMGGCLILESIAIFKWCERQGFGPLGLTGLSMGGHMASLAATNWPKPAVLVPCLSWSTASQVFTEGVMADGINWQLLQNQYFSDVVFRNEIKKMVHIDEEAAFLAGRHFAKNYPASLEKMITSLGGGEVPSFSDQEVHLFMRGIMDECTHLANFEVPVDTDLIIAVCAQRDAYVPRDGCADLAEVWPGAEVRFVDAGHVTAFLLHHGLFRKTIIEAYDRWRRKYMTNNFVNKTSATSSTSDTTTTSKVSNNESFQSVMK